MTEAKGLEPQIVTPEDGEAIRPFGLNMQIMLTTEQTGGAFSAIVAEHAPGEGPPPHFHRGQEEYVFVLEGRYEVTVGDVTRTVGPGTIMFIPRGTVHSFRNVGDTVGRQLDWSLPGGQDRYFRTIDAMAKGAGFGAEAIHKVSAEFDTAFPA